MIAEFKPLEKTVENVKVSRIRGIAKAVDEIKEADAETILTYDRLLRMVHDGTVPSIKLGRRYFVNMDILTEYLNNGTKPENTAPRGGIRRIKE